MTDEIPEKMRLVHKSSHVNKTEMIYFINFYDNMILEKLIILVPYILLHNIFNIPANNRSLQILLMDYTNYYVGLIIAYAMYAYILF